MTTSQVVCIDDDQLTPRGRFLAGLLAVLLLVAGVCTLAAAGVTPLTGARTAIGSSAAAPSAFTNGGSTTGDAASAAGTETAESTNGVIPATWDGPVVSLAWDGDIQTLAAASFVGDRVASPGDKVQRTLTVQNSGPSDAVMEVDLLVAQEVPVGSANPDLAEAISLYWDVVGVGGSEKFSDLLHRGDSTVAEVRVAKGGTAAVTVGFTMPADITTEQARSELSTLLSFDVVVSMRGDSTTDSTNGSAAGSTRGSGTGISGVLATTGLGVVGVLAMVIGLLIFGWLLVAAARRRRADDAGCSDDASEESAVCEVCAAKGTR